MAVSSTTPERVLLYLPSFFNEEDQAMICKADLGRIEGSLRHAGAHENLDDLCSQLRLRTYVARERETYRGSQAMFTRSHAVQSTIEQIGLQRDQYRLHREALIKLCWEGDWEEELQELKQEDVRGISKKALKDSDREAYRRAQMMTGVSGHEADAMANDLLPDPAMPGLTVGDGKRIISWIWTSRRGKRNGADSEEDDTGVCSSFCFPRMVLRASQC
jgi:hypothetical protein